MRREWEALAPTRTGGEVDASSKPCHATAGANSRGTDMSLSVGRQPLKARSPGWIAPSGASRSPREAPARPETHGQNVTRRPSDKLNPAPPAAVLRYQNWKNRTSPDWMPA